MVFMDIVKVSSSPYGLSGLFNCGFVNTWREWSGILLILHNEEENTESRER